jgi:hypothetical protein
VSCTAFPRRRQPLGQHVDMAVQPNLGSGFGSTIKVLA